MPQVTSTTHFLCSLPSSSLLPPLYTACQTSFFLLPSALPPLRASLSLFARLFLFLAFAFNYPLLAFGSLANIARSLPSLLFSFSFFLSPPPLSLSLLLYLSDSLTRFTHSPALPTRSTSEVTGTRGLFFLVTREHYALRAISLPRSFRDNSVGTSPSPCALISRYEKRQQLKDRSARFFII